MWFKFPIRQRNAYGAVAAAIESVTAFDPKSYRCLLGGREYSKRRCDNDHAWDLGNGHQRWIWRMDR